MKISEVCENTGLTKRAIRFYTEKGLLTPATVKKEHRDYYEYSDEDVRLLKSIAVLRKLDISVDDISKMITQPHSIVDIVSEYREQSRKRYEETEKIMNILFGVDTGCCTDIFALAQSVESADQSERLPQKDIAPDFTKFEDMTEEEKTEAYMRFSDDLRRKNKLEKVLKPIIVFIIIAAVLFLIYFIFKARIMNVSYDGEAHVIDNNGNIIQTVEISLSAKAYLYRDKLGWSGLRLSEEFIRYMLGYITVKTDEKEYGIELEWYNNSMRVCDDIMAISCSVSVEEYNKLFDPNWKFEVPENLQDIGVDWEEVYMNDYVNSYERIYIAIDLKNDRAFILQKSPWIIDEYYHIFDQIDAE